MEKYYIGIGIKNLFNKKVKVLEKVAMFGTNKDAPVYKCEDEKGVFYRILECNLSDNPVKEYEYKYGGMGDCFPSSVERFPSFKNGKYMLEYTWGNY